MLQTYLSVAVQAARTAGALVAAKLGAYATLATKSGVHDLVTDVDRASEEIISRTVLGAFPDHRFLGEEGVTAGPSRHEQDADAAGVEYLWVCDPIDGTTNFVHGIPCCTVAISLAHRGQPVLGLVYDPVRDEMFTAMKGGGAHLNGRSIRVRPEAELSESLLATGFATRLESRGPNVNGLVTVAPHCRNIRALGSAQLHLAYVAAGRLTGFWEIGLSPWDIAAGAVLVTEAGGRVTACTGEPYTLPTCDVMATNGLIHAELQRVLLGAV